MEIFKLLNKLYYDKKHPAAFASIEKLYYYAKKLNKKITRKIVKNWLSSQLTYTLHRDARKTWKRNKIHVYGPNEQFQADLTFMREFSKQNKGYNYMLTIIDCFSKFGYAFPLKTKQPTEIKKCLIKVFKKAKPVKFQTDKGKEFNNSTIKNFLKKENINFFTSNDKTIKSSIVERFNRTIKYKMFKIFTATGRHTWYNIIDDIIYAYNRSKHRSTGFRPIDVNYDNAKKVYENLYKTPVKIKKSEIKTNDTVRVAYDKKVFDRSYYPNWTDSTHKVTKIIKENKPLYKVEGHKNRRFYSEEIQKIRPDLYRVEKIIKRRKIRGKVEYLIKWIGYPETESTWISAKNLTRL